MKPFKLSLLLALVALLIGALPLSRTHAQDGDGLSEEEQAALERALAALEGLDDYESYRTEETSIFENTLTGTMQEQELDQFNRQERTGEATYVLVDGEPNLRLLTELSVVEGSADAAYAYEAELRLVEGTFYANVDVLEDEAAALALPEGWFELEEDSEAWYSLDALELEQYLEQGRPFTLEVDEVTGAADLVSRVEVGSEELADGTALEIINIVFGADAVAELFDDGEDAGDLMDQLMQENVTEESFYEVTVGLDEDDTVRLFRLAGVLDTDTMDFSTVDDSLAEGEIVFIVKFDFEYEFIFSEVNADLEPVAAPEIE